MQILFLFNNWNKIIVNFVMWKLVVLSELKNNVYLLLLLLLLEVK